MYFSIINSNNTNNTSTPDASSCNIITSNASEKVFSVQVPLISVFLVTLLSRFSVSIPSTQVLYAQISLIESTSVQKTLIQVLLASIALTQASLEQILAVREAFLA